jgi:hypothetical protein
VAQRGGEVEVAVGEAVGRGVGVVEEVRMGFEDALDEERIVCVDGPPEAE